jgi:hypothetical protein
MRINMIRIKFIYRSDTQIIEFHDLTGYFIYFNIILILNDLNEADIV